MEGYTNIQLLIYRPIQIGNAIINSFQRDHNDANGHVSGEPAPNTKTFTGDVAMHSPEEWTHQGNIIPNSQ